MYTVTKWPNRDPIEGVWTSSKNKNVISFNKTGIGTIGILRYTFVLNQPIHLIDVDGTKCIHQELT